jgi:hypothetical protein
MKKSFTEIVVPQGLVPGAVIRVLHDGMRTTCEFDGQAYPLDEVGMRRMTPKPGEERSLVVIRRQPRAAINRNK